MPIITAMAQQNIITPRTSATFVTKTQYAVKFFGKRVSPWRDSRFETKIDAIRLGHGSTEPWSDAVYLGPGADWMMRKVHQKIETTSSCTVMPGGKNG